MHRYQPVVQLIRYHSDGPRVELTFEPEYLRFMACHRYQNEELAQLKFRYNPLGRMVSERKRKEAQLKKELAGTSCLSSGLQLAISQFFSRRR